ncbi:MAG: HNH endonuclease [Paracoccaceae bacterium]
MPLKIQIPVDQLREAISYDPVTGDLTWLLRPRSHFPSDRIWRSANANFCGKPALRYVNGHGYLYGTFMQKKVAAHRVAFALMLGAWPTGDIDHINGTTTDNRWENLRMATKSENSRNMKKSKRNKSGTTGVGWNTANMKWIAYIRANGRQISLGSFTDKALAVAARKSAERTYCYHNNHGRTVQSLRVT